MLEFDQSRIESMNPRQLGKAIWYRRQAAFKAIKSPEFSRAERQLDLLGVLHREYTAKTGRDYPIKPPTGRVGR